MQETKELKPVVKGRDISPEMERDIIETAEKGLKKMHTIQ